MKDTRNWQVSITTPGAIVEGVEDIAQCVYVIITTVPGSDPLRPDFGSNLHEYIDKPINEVQPLLIYAISEALKKWEKRIAVQKCRLVANGIDTRSIMIEAIIVASAVQILITVII